MAGPCDLWLACGQSNMAGRGDSSQSLIVPEGDGFEWRSGSFIHLADPIGVGASAANTGSMVPAFVRALTAVTGRPSIVVPCAAGGTSLLEGSAGANGGWWDGGNRYTTAISRAESAIVDLDDDDWEPETINVLWHQGERDAQNYPTPATLEADYQAAFVDLLARFRTDLSLPTLKIYCWRVGDQAGYEATYASVRAAQDAACAATPGLEMVYTRCADFAALGWMKSDGLHYTQDGLNDMGTRGAYVVAVDMGFDPPEPPPPGRSRPPLADLLLLAS